MSRNGLRNPIFLFYILVFYVLIQFVWWLYLIFRLYGDVYKEPEVIRQKVYMLVGEGTVFLVILIVGIIAIRRAFKKEVEVHQQQENFLHSVTHELKTPIASIKLFLQTLQRRDLSEEKRSEIYDQTIKETDRLNILVGDLLLARSIENDNYYLQEEKKDLKVLLEEIVNSLQNGILKDRKIEYQLESAVASVDAKAFVSICTNLLENASKYSPENSVITIGLIKKGTEVELRISDQGTGISDEQKEKVFEKFYRAENEMTRKSKGTGLGLHIAKQLVEKHNGTIHLEDNQPNGLVVVIRLKDE